MLVIIFASFSDSFKYFHTADVFAALVRASIRSRHVIVLLYNLFCLFVYSAEHRKSFFLLFPAEQFWLPNIPCIPNKNISVMTTLGGMAWYVHDNDNVLVLAE